MTFLVFIKKFCTHTEESEYKGSNQEANIKAAGNKKGEEQIDIENKLCASTSQEKRHHSKLISQ